MSLDGVATWGGGGVATCVDVSGMSGDDGSGVMTPHDAALSLARPRVRLCPAWAWLLGVVPVYERNFWRSSSSQRACLAAMAASEMSYKNKQRVLFETPSIYK